MSKKASLSREEVKFFENLFQKNFSSLLSEFKSEMNKNTSSLTSVIQKETNNVCQEFQKSLEKLKAKTVLHPNKNQSSPNNELTNAQRFEYFQHMKRRPVLHKVISIMRYTISTKSGVITCWPFELRDGQCVFVTSIEILKFVSKHLFKNNLKPTEIDEIISILDECQIETYLFEDQEIERVRKFFPLEPIKKPNKSDKNTKWFGIRVEILKELFFHAKSDCMKKMVEMKEWQQNDLLSKKSTVSFPDWGLTRTSRSKIYPTTSEKMIKGKIQWGIPMTQDFFTTDFYKAIAKLKIRPFAKPTVPVHIGCGWTVLSNEPVTDKTYGNNFNIAPVKKKVDKPNKRKRKQKQENNNIKKKRKTVSESSKGDEQNEPDEQDEQDEQDVNESEEHLNEKHTVSLKKTHIDDGDDGNGGDDDDDAYQSTENRDERNKKDERETEDVDVDIETPYCNSVFSFHPNLLLPDLITMTPSICEPLPCTSEIALQPPPSPSPQQTVTQPLNSSSLSGTTHKISLKQKEALLKLRAQRMANKCDDNEEKEKGEEEENTESMKDTQVSKNNLSEETNTKNSQEIDLE